MNFFASRKTDLLDFKTSAAERNKWTPDASALENHAFHLFFAHDRFQEEFPEHGKLIEEHVLGTSPIGFTDEKFVMQKSRLGKDTYPVIQRKDYNLTPPRRIKGQLYYLMTEAFRGLDSVMRNGVEYRRELINIYIPYANLLKLPSLEDGGRHKAEYRAIFGTEHPSITVPKNRTIPAHCYIGIDEYWDDLITPYQWSNVTSYMSHREDVGSYYHFTKRELFDHQYE